MIKENISKSLNEVDSDYIEEATNFSNSKKSIKLTFVKMPLVAVILIVLLFGTIATAGINIYQNSTQIEFQDGSTVQLFESVPFRKIPETVPKTEEYESGISMTHDKVEEILGFEILDYKNAYEDSISYRTWLNEDGSIAIVHLNWASFLKVDEEKYATFSVDIVNEETDESYLLPIIEGVDPNAGLTYNETYKINSLQTEAIFCTYTNEAVPYPDFVTDDGRVKVEFVYDNVIYKLLFRGYTNEEIKIILEELE
ncbi:MAG: hypothetical protein E7556_02690 [Ruminococcaceae bacterium]|nr:hypothetical protein [Oscillospiraceae bacterium]